MYIKNEFLSFDTIQRPEAHGPQWLTWVNGYKNLIQHFSFSVAMATNQNTADNGQSPHIPGRSYQRYVETIL